MVLRFTQSHVRSRVKVTAHRERRADQDEEQRGVRLGKRCHRVALQECLSQAVPAHSFLFLTDIMLASSLALRRRQSRARHA
jgi:hypothetical protein